MSKYQETRSVILDILAKYKEIELPTNPELLRIHIDAATEKIEEIWS